MVEAAEVDRKLVGRMALTVGRSMLPAIVIALAIACCSAQSSGTGDQPVADMPPHAFPPPSNLKVLPKELTGQQVREVMRQWKFELGVRCDACHKEDDVKVDTRGNPLLDFANDSKPMKDIARLMYTMTEEINRKYVANVEGSGLPVTCGTCHRGRVAPEPFTSEPSGPVRLSHATQPSN